MKSNKEVKGIDLSDERQDLKITLPDATDIYVYKDGEVLRVEPKRSCLGVRVLLADLARFWIAYVMESDLPRYPAGSFWELEHGKDFVSPGEHYLDVYTFGHPLRVNCALLEGPEQLNQVYMSAALIDVDKDKSIDATGKELKVGQKVLFPEEYWNFAGTQGKQVRGIVKADALIGMFR